MHGTQALLVSTELSCTACCLLSGMARKLCKWAGLTCITCCLQVCPADWKPGEQSLNPAASDKYFESAKASQDVEETNLKVGLDGEGALHLPLNSLAFAMASYTHLHSSSWAFARVNGLCLQLEQVHHPETASAL